MPVGKGFAVKTTFTAKDKVSKAFGNMSRSAKRFGDSSSMAFRNASRGATQFGNITKGVLAAGVIQRGIGQLTFGLGQVTRQFIEFDKATIGAATRFKDIGPDAANFEQKLSDIRKAAREAGATTEFTAAQAAEALDFLARAGFTSAEAFGSLGSMINLATASGEDFATVADYSSDLLGAFGLNVDNTAQKIANLTRLNDVLVKAANSANVTIETMFETMKDVGPIATAMGQSLEEVTAVTAFLGGAGIKGSLAGTALKNAILKLVSPSSKAIQMIKELGITVDDGTGNMRGLNAILGDLAPKLAKMGNVKAGKILDEIFGKRAIAGAINISQGTDAIIKLQKALENAGGTAQKTADLIRKSLGNRLLSLASAATEVGFKIIEAFEVNGEDAITRMTNALRKVDPTPIIIAIGTLVEITKTLYNILKPFGPLLPYIVTGWIAFGAALKVLAIAKAVSNFILFWNAIRQVAGAMAILNAVIAANPVGAIIVGVTALIFLIVKFRKELLGIGKIILAALLLPLQAVFKLASLIPGFSRAGKAAGEIADMRKNLIFSGLDDITGDKTQPPNSVEAQTRQRVDFNGRLEVSGAPAGSTLKGETKGAPPVRLELLGDNLS